jgi:histidyl-tRNA synthetase
VKYNSLRGMQDIFPSNVFLWQYLESEAKRIFELFNFQEIRTPILENAEVFLRSIGEDTDIVEKEMYIFDDKKGRKIALRPEGTAGVVRAYIQNQLFNNPSPQKFYYIGAMFRYERPQKGRFRQFHQIGVESFGVSSPSVEAEMLYMLKILFESLGIKNLNFEINSIGCKNCRPNYKEAINKFLSDKISLFCNDCQRRYNRNPLRILDCKVPSCKEILKNVPQILDFLCNNCKEHLSKFQKELEILNVSHIINPRIVRGLDYYTKTVFEITTKMLGTQNAIAAGGRYDELVKAFGGPDTPAAGFAIGMERFIEVCKTNLKIEPKKPILYVAYAGKGLDREVKKLVNFFRDKKIATETPYEELSLKSQLKKADRLSVEWVVIVGEDEIKKSLYRWKNMKTGSQGVGTIEEILKIIRGENDIK